MRLLLRLVLILGLSMAGPAFAQDEVASGVTYRETLVRRYFDAIDFDKMIETMNASMADLQTERLAAETELSDEDQRIFAEVLRDFTREVQTRMTDRFVTLYAETFTEDELLALVAFYESEVGQSITMKSTAVAAQTGPVLAELVPWIEETARARICARIKCPTSAK